MHSLWKNRKFCQKRSSVIHLFRFYISCQLVKKVGDDKIQQDLRPGLDQKYFDWINQIKDDKEVPEFIQSEYKIGPLKIFSSKDRPDEVKFEKDQSVYFKHENSNFLIQWPCSIKKEKFGRVCFTPNSKRFLTKRTTLTLRVLKWVTVWATFREASSPPTPTD